MKHLRLLWLFFLLLVIAACGQPVVTQAISPIVPTATPTTLAAVLCKDQTGPQTFVIPNGQNNTPMRILSGMCYVELHGPMSGDAPGSYPFTRLEPIPSKLHNTGSAFVLKGLLLASNLSCIIDNASYMQLDDTAASYILVKFKDLTTQDQVCELVYVFPYS